MNKLANTPPASMNTTIKSAHNSKGRRGAASMVEISSSSRSPIAVSENSLSALTFPAVAIVSSSVALNWYSTLSITAVHASSLCASRSQPVTPSTIVSKGPPVLEANTGRPARIASTGTIPKCSLIGVYRSSLDCTNKVSLKVVGTERRKRTSISSGMDSAETTVLEVAVLRPNPVASSSNSR